MYMNYPVRISFPLPIYNHIGSSFQKTGIFCFKHGFKNFFAYFSISFNTNQTFARLPQGNFVARIFGSQVNYAVTPFLSFSNLIQYDNRSGNLGLQSRVRLTVRPGNDLFFVFGQGWVQDLERGYDFRRQDTKLATKFQYTFRF